MKIFQINNYNFYSKISYKVIDLILGLFIYIILTIILILIPNSGDILFDQIGFLLAKNLNKLIALLIFGLIFNLLPIIFIIISFSFKRKYIGIGILSCILIIFILLYHVIDEMSINWI